MNNRKHLCCSKCGKEMMIYEDVYVEKYGKDAVYTYTCMECFRFDVNKRVEINQFGFRRLDDDND